MKLTIEINCYPTFRRLLAAMVAKRAYEGYVWHCENESIATGIISPYEKFIKQEPWQIINYFTVWLRFVRGVNPTPWRWPERKLLLYALFVW